MSLQPGRDAAGMHGETRDAVLGVQEFGESARVEDVCRFGLAVCEVAVVGFRVADGEVEELLDERDVGLFGGGEGGRWESELGVRHADGGEYVAEGC